MENESTENFNENKVNEIFKKLTKNEFEHTKTLTRSQINHAIEHLSAPEQDYILSKLEAFLTTHHTSLKNLVE